MLNVCKAFLPYLRATPGERTITNFGSNISWAGGPGYGLYAGTKFATSGISESMRLELEPFGIKVTVVEPGAFRTGFLNKGARVLSEKRIKEYDESVVGVLRNKGVDAIDNKQPGDVVKGSKVIVDILTRTGVADGKEIPVRVPLGSDGAPVIRKKMEDTEALLKEWEGVTTNTDLA